MRSEGGGLKLTVKEMENHLEPFQGVNGFKNLLLLSKLQMEGHGNQVGKSARVIDFIQGFQDLFGNRFAHGEGDLKKRTDALNKCFGKRCPFLMLMHFFYFCFKVRILLGDILKRDARNPFHKDFSTLIRQLNKLQDFTYCSYGKKVFGMRISERRIPQANTSDKSIFQDSLIQDGEDLFRLKKERSHDVREDNNVFERDKE
jgi:hypothetical protein